MNRTVAEGSISMGARLIITREGPIALWQVSDPQTRNALMGDDFYAAIEAAVDEANADLSIRAVILTGDGAAFSSGGNVRDMAEKKGMFGGTPDQIVEQYRSGIQRIPRAFARLDVPAIAAVNGAAIGAGCDLALMCDLRIASQTAVFAESFVKVGIVAGDGGSWLLPRIVGYAKAAEMAFTGEPVAAAEALAIGLVSKVVAPDELLPAAFELAKRIAANPPQVLRWTKRLLRDSQHERLDSILSQAAAYQAIAHHTHDHAEAVAALLEKRKPEFKGS
jgi:2-(1,2-epoxy-1,2-dihydrophenyl)acetyl-CoA isomerase